MAKGKINVWGAKPVLLAGAAVFLTIAGLPSAEASYTHRRATSIYGLRPAHWGQEHPAPTFRDLWGRRHARLSKSDAAIAQLDPRLRGNDGHLLEEVGGPSRWEGEAASYGCDLPLYQGTPSFAYLPRGFGFHRFFLHRGRR